MGLVFSPFKGLSDMLAPQSSAAVAAGVTPPAVPTAPKKQGFFAKHGFNEALQGSLPLIMAMSQGLQQGNPGAYMGQGLAGMIGLAQRRKAEEEADAKKAAEAKAKADALEWTKAALGWGGRPDMSPVHTPTANPSGLPPSVVAAVDKHDPQYAASALPSSLIGTESGGRFTARNDAVGAGGHVGHFGRGQFGVARLEDAKRAGVIPADMTPEQFLANKSAQGATERWHVEDIMGFISQNGLDQYYGQKIGGVTMTPKGMLAVAHLGGKEGLRRFLETGGQYNPADANGTTLRQYASIHGGQGTALTPDRAAQILASEHVPAAVKQMVMQQFQPPAQEGWRTLTPQEVSGMGLPEGAYQVGLSGANRGKIVKAGGGGVNVNVNTPGPNGGVPFDEAELRKKLGAKQGELWSTHLDQGNVAAGVAQDMQVLEQLVGLLPEDPIPRTLAAAFPQYNSAGAAFNSIVKRLAPSFRTPGSGSTSDIEYEGMLQALPQIKNSPEANRLILSMVQAKSQINMDRAAVVRAYQASELSHVQAQQALAEIDQRSIMSPEMARLIGDVGGEELSPEEKAWLDG